MKKWQLILVHIFYWLIFMLRQFLSTKDGISIKIDDLDVSIFVVNFGAFYLNYCLILPFVLKKQKFYFLILGFIASFFGFIFLRYFTEEIVLPRLVGHGNYFEGTPFSFYIFDNLYYGSSAVFISSLIWFLDFALKKDRENKILLEEKNTAEIALLKSQINPHFIFNTLNNIYALVNMKSEKALTAIEKLGDLLRISGSEIHHDFIPVKTESLYIKSLIDLEQLRLKNPEIRFEEQLENPSAEIAPMLLIPFVENAFKHGDLNGFPLEISLKNDDKTVNFNLKNKIFNGKKDHSTGIGIENVKKRLRLIYPEKHKLEISENGGFYEVKLKIILR